MVSCISPWIGTTFEPVDCLQANIIRAKCNKCKDSVSLQNTNHVQTYVVHEDSNKIKVLCNFFDGVFRSTDFSGTTLCPKSYLQVIMK